MDLFKTSDLYKSVVAPSSYYYRVSQPNLSANPTFMFYIPSKDGKNDLWINFNSHNQLRYKYLLSYFSNEIKLIVFFFLIHLLANGCQKLDQAFQVDQPPPWLFQPEIVLFIKTDHLKIC